jgi:isoamylase
MAVLLLSQGVPMILSGDEVMRTQRGNNNGYCQDNELSWFDWALPQKQSDMLRFVSRMIAFRKRHPSLMRTRFLTGRKTKRGLFPDVTWHGTKLGEPLWHDPGAQILAYTLGRQAEGEEDLHIIFNMSDQPVDVDMPPLSRGAWHRAIDTGQPSPADILEPSDQPRSSESTARVLPRSVVVFESRATKKM